MADSESSNPQQSQKSLADQSKEKILFTAMKLFARNGYHKTPAASIAKAANISHGLLFYHFGSKEKLLQAIVNYIVAKIEGVVEVDHDLPPTEGLGALCRNFKQSLQDDRNFWELYHSLIFQPSLKGEIVEPLNGVFEEYRKELVKVFEKLGYLTPSDTMLQFEAMRHGIMVAFLIQGADYPIDKLFRNLSERFG